MIDHIHELADSLVIPFVETARLFAVEIAALDGELQPDLSFGRLGLASVEVLNKGGRIATSTPCLGQVSRDRT